MFQNSTLCGKSFPLVKTAQNVRGCGTLKIIQKIAYVVKYFSPLFYLIEIDFCNNFNIYSDSSLHLL